MHESYSRWWGKSLIHTACDLFPITLLSLCLVRAKKNMKWKLVDELRINEEESKQIFQDLFGSSFQTGLIEIGQPDQFERYEQTLIDKRKYASKKQVAFAEYFGTFKKEQFRYHV